MKRILFVFSFFLVSCINLSATKILILQPDSVSGKDAFVHSFHPDENYGKHHLLQALNWTISGLDAKLRFFIDFDLSSIPEKAIIVSAKLSLFESHENAASEGHSHLSGPNECYISRVTSPWCEHTITWNNQPIYSIHNQVLIPQDTISTQDYIDIDVTPLIMDIRNYPGTSYGLMCMLVTEQPYRSLLFASSDHENIDKRPKLVVKYDLPADTINLIPLDTLILQPDSLSGKDAFVHSFHPDENYGKSNLLQALNWTISGLDAKLRFFIDFDLSSIPEKAIIVSAKLSLFESHENAASEGHSHLSGPNECYIRRVTSPWCEHTITWNNQPTYSTHNQVYIPQDTISTQDYIDIDVTPLIMDIRNYPGTSYGLMCMLATEQPYRSLLFASSDHENIEKRPELVVKYYIPIETLTDNFIGYYVIEEINSSKTMPNHSDTIDYEIEINYSSVDTFDLQFVLETSSQDTIRAKVLNDSTFEIPMQDYINYDSTVLFITGYGKIFGDSIEIIYNTGGPVDSFHCVCKGTKKVTGLKRIGDNKSKIQIFPNPVTDFLNLDLKLSQNTIHELPLTILIYNTTGSIILRKELYCHSVNVSDLIPGSYYFIILEGSKKYSGFFIKK